MSDQPADIRERIGAVNARRESQRMWDAIDAMNNRHQASSSSSRRRRDYSDITPDHPPFTVVKPVKPPGRPPHMWFTCQRMGIPYDPDYEHRSQHRGHWPNDCLTIEDVTDDHKTPRPTVPDNSSGHEPETWVLDAEYLQNSYLMNGSINPDSYVWEADVYDRTWISVGLVLKDEAFKHVSSYFI